MTWVGKYDEEKPVEPRILIEDKEKSYGDTASENMLIHGDNLIALQALQQDFYNSIKCIYIDPFAGSGSTLIACEQIGRVCFGVELEPKFIDVAVKRYMKFHDDKIEDVVLIRDGKQYSYEQAIAMMKEAGDE